MRVNMLSNGRLNIPKGMRDELDFNHGDTLDFTMKNGALIITKVNQSCFRCKSKKELNQIGEKTYICNDCIEVMKEYFK